MFNPTHPLAVLLATTCLTAPASTGTDAAIEAAIRRCYTFREHLKRDSIEVAAKDGVVTLTGTVANEYHKNLAQDTVQSLPAVKAVDNRLRVQEETPSPISDSWLATKVKTALMYHRNVDATATQVEAKDGVVTLSGTASSIAQKELTADITRDLDGVKEVRNELRVATSSPHKKSLTEKIDDASITAQAKAVLLAHRGTHMLSTKVKTDRSVVTLRGEARNPAEKDLVTRLIAGVKGVKRVENRMTVER